MCRNCCGNNVNTGLVHSGMDTEPLRVSLADPLGHLWTTLGRHYPAKTWFDLELRSLEVGPAPWALFCDVVWLKICTMTQNFPADQSIVTSESMLFTSPLVVLMLWLISVHRCIRYIHIALHKGFRYKWDTMSVRQDSWGLCMYSHVFKLKALDAKLRFIQNIANIV